MTDASRRARKLARAAADTALGLAAVVRTLWVVRARGVELDRDAESPSPGPGDGGPDGASSRADGATLARARRLASASERAARLLPVRPSCLVRALALRELLRRRGIDGSRVRVGVRREEDGFAAHAWLEYRGRVLDSFGASSAEFEGLDIDVDPGR